MLESFQNAALSMHPAEWAIAGTFALLFLVRVVYMAFFSGRVAIQKKQAGGQRNPVSILMTLRNEEDCLRKNMPRLLSLNNVDFEVVAVDDFSHDNSLTVLGAFRANSPRLKVSSLSQETRYSEKLSQNVALKAAHNEWVMVVPPSVNQFNEHWLATVSENLDEGKDLVVSYSNVQSGNSFIHLLFRVEYFFQQLKSFGFILNGLPYVISEDNVAFRQKKYFEVGGFRGKIAEPFANLELVINAFISKPKTSLLLNNATVFKKDLSIGANQFWELLQKEISIQRLLPAGRKFWIGFFELTKWLFVMLAILIPVVIPAFLPIVSGLLFVLLLGNSLIIKKILNRLDEGKLFLPSLLVGCFIPVLKVFYSLLNYNRGQKKKWKRKK